MNSLQVTLCVLRNGFDVEVEVTGSVRVDEVSVESVAGLEPSDALAIDELEAAEWALLEAARDAVDCAFDCGHEWA